MQCRKRFNSASIIRNQKTRTRGRWMSLQNNHAQFEQLKPRLQQVEFDHLKARLDSAQLERTVAALHQTLPATKASEAEATLRRMYARAKRWQD
jgi:hypothetical protein